MNWIILAILLFGISTVMYLTFRKLSLLRTKNEIQNLILFLPSAVILFFYSLLNNLKMSLSWPEFVIIFLGSVFIWAGNVMLLKSIKLAPNPGYTVMIGKSYVILTVLLSPIFFGSILTFKSLVLIGFILFFMSLILIEKKDTKTTIKTDWILPAFLAFLFWGIMSLLLISMKNSSLTTEVIIMYLSVFSSLIIGVEMFVRRVKLKMVTGHLPWLVILGLVGLFFNVVIMAGYKIAPNPGYMDAVNASSVAAITLFSALIFKDEITLKKAFGIGGVIVCLILFFL